MPIEMNRREAIALGVASMTAIALPGRAQTVALAPLVQAHAERVTQVMGTQVTDPASRWCGGIPDMWEIHHGHAAAGFLRDGAAAYFHADSPLHANQTLFDRLKLAADFLLRGE